MGASVGASSFRWFLSGFRWVLLVEDNLGWLGGFRWFVVLVVTPISYHTEELFRYYTHCRT